MTITKLWMVAGLTRKWDGYEREKKEEKRTGISLLGEPGPLARGGQIVPEIHLYLTQPPEKEVPPLEGLKDILKRLEHVSEARPEPTAWSPYHLKVAGQNNRR